MSYIIHFLAKTRDFNLILLSDYMHRPFTFVSARLRNIALMSRHEATIFTRQLYSGESTAWAELVDDWSSPLYSYLIYNGINEGEAKKLVHLIFSEVVQTVVGAVRVANLAILIFSIANHYVLHYCCKNLNPVLKKQWPPRAAADEDNNQGMNFPLRFHQFMPEVRQILLLHYLCGVSLAEIAQIVGQSEEALTQTMHQAKLNLQVS